MSMDAFRQQILLISDEEKVKVNQRHLIDKILARYSSEFVIYRELMQNSDDAKSSKIEIKFETEKNRILFRNNGFPFRPEDWDRLKNIAEGNPDEKKIGAFGVGFYSLFSICEEPFVCSGGQAMTFYWRGNRLVTKHGPIDDEDKVWTTFLLDMRKPIEPPKVEEFARFLANSLAFTGNLNEASVYSDDKLVIRLSKEMQNSEPLDINDFLTFSPQMMFELTSVDVKSVKLNLYMDDAFNVEKNSICFSIANGNLDVRVDDEFSEEMEQIIKKKPPKETSLQIIFTGFNERNENISSVFTDLLPYPGQGKIYIGFQTHQTTGCCSHLTAYVIPTVERESIDFAREILAEYNKEMLSLAGTLCRILYENEMAQISRSYNGMVDPNIEQLEKQAAYALTHFTFNSSTPSAQVGKIIESRFFGCKQVLPILSTNGVLPISDVRMPNSEMAGFIRKIPVVPKTILEQCSIFVEKAKKNILGLMELKLQDILDELKIRILSEDEIIELLKWWISYRSSGNHVSPPEFADFMQFACIGDRSQPLRAIRNFLNPNTIIPSVINVGIPPGILPYNISKNFDKQELVKWFKWSELSLVNWARFIVRNPNLENNPTFAEEVHKILVRALYASPGDKETIHEIFKQKKCIPTTSGMKVPSEAYFEEVNNLFPGLPTIKFQYLTSSIKSLMELLCVRKVVEVNLIISSLVNQTDCDYTQVVKYLASKSNDLKDDEIKALKNRPIWPKENSTQHSIISDLCTPSPVHRELGLPLIRWNGRWSRKTPEGKFLANLGLKEYPTLRNILELAAPPTDPEIRKKALKYFIDSLEKIYSENYNPNEIDIAFLPCSDLISYAKPSECFVNPECKIMNFQVIRQDLRFYVERLGVRQQPDRKKLIDKLILNPLRDLSDARKVFEYLASRQAEFNRHEWNTFSKSIFIPIQQHDVIFLTDPISCFFEVERELNDFLTRIDFGEKANKFLEYCGVKSKPTSIDYAELLVKSSHKLWHSLENKEKYLEILKIIAKDYHTFCNISSRSQLIKKMKKASFLVATIKEAVSDEIKLSLGAAKKIFINDDKIYQEVFNPLVAPEDDSLENLYKKLGCKSLHDSVKETSIQKGNIRETRSSQQLQETIVGRASLFYHSCHKNEVKRNEEWLKKLKVREIGHIETTYKLENTVVSRKNNVAILQDGRAWTLYVTREINLLDVSKHIAKNIYNWNNWKEMSFVNMILTTPLQSLKGLGYPVDRILQKTKSSHTVDQTKVDDKNNNSLPADINSLVENSTFQSNSKTSAVENSTFQSNSKTSAVENSTFQSNSKTSAVENSTFQSNSKTSAVENSTFQSNSKTSTAVSAASPLNITNKDSVVITNKESYVVTNKKPVITTNKGPVTIMNGEPVTSNRDPVFITNDESIIRTNEGPVTIKNEKSAATISETTQNLRDVIKAYYSNPESIIANNFQEAIKLREFKRGGITNHQDSVKIVNDNQMSYCSIIDDDSLHRVEIIEGIEFYILIDQLEILSQAYYITPLRQFTNMLKDLAKVFKLAPKDIHVFYDENSISFNRDKTLFFNLKCYIELHEEGCKLKPTINAVTYWFMIFCHGLAHNFIPLHNSEHEYCFLLLAESYMQNFLEMMKEREIF